MNKDRQQILNFLENGEGKDAVQERLSDPEFRQLYLSITREEAALYQVFSESKILSTKKKRNIRKKKHKTKKFPVYILSSLAALLAIALVLLNTVKAKVAYNTITKTWYHAGSHFASNESATFTLEDGSRLTFKGPSDLNFSDDQNIIINKGLLQASIKPRPKNKLSFQTPSGPFTVIGTEFSLWVQPESSFLNVNEGKVAVAKKIIQTNEQALLIQDKGLSNSPQQMNLFKSSLTLRELASHPKASFVTDFQVQNGQFTNMVNSEKIPLPDHIHVSKHGLKFNEKEAIEVLPVGKPAVNLNLSVWLKYDRPNLRQAIASHEYFGDQNIGGWKLYYFERFMRMHTVIQPHYHARSDIKNILNKWFHLSINIKSLQQGNIEITAFINGNKAVSYNRQMLFLNKQQKLFIGGLTKQAISGFAEENQKHNFFYKGEMADFIYMNDVLPVETIKNLYEKSRPKFE
jgi:hypothetical protein